MAESAAKAEGAPDQVSRIFPSLARTRATVAELKVGTQTSAPSERGIRGLPPRVVIASAPMPWGAENWPSDARRLPLFRTLSTVLERKVAIWSRETGLAGS